MRQRRVRRPRPPLRSLARPIEPWPAPDPVPPDLLAARVETVPGRGEMFFRYHEGPTGAPVVLLLHGWTASADLNWFLVWPALTDRYTVVAPDHRGHGRGIRSDQPFTLEDCADDAAALLRHLGAGPATVVGYSMGGPIALLLAHRHRSQVGALVLEATALEWRSSLRERIVWRLAGFLGVVFRSGVLHQFVMRGVRAAVEEVPVLAPHAAWLSGELKRGHPGDLADAAKALSRYDARPFAAGLRHPSAVVVTTQDDLVRPRKQRALADALDARVFELTADHNAPLLEGPALAAVTRRAIDHVVAAGGAGLEAAG